MSDIMDIPDLEVAMRRGSDMALKLLPIVKLKDNLSNFQEWEHSIRFYLRYYKLLAFIGEGSPPELVRRTNESEDTHRRRLFVYSLIWKSAEAALCPPNMLNTNRNTDLQRKVHQSREHDPKLLWDTLCAEGRSVQQSKATNFDTSSW